MIHSGNLSPPPHTLRVGGGGAPPRPIFLRKMGRGGRLQTGLPNTLRRRPLPKEGVVTDFSLKNLTTPTSLSVERGPVPPPPPPTHPHTHIVRVWGSAWGGRGGGCNPELQTLFVILGSRQGSPHLFQSEATPSSLGQRG